MQHASPREWFLSFTRLFFTHRCVVCGRSLMQGEEILCLHCNMDLPRTNFHLTAGNPVERMFWGKIPLQRATAYFHYHKGSMFKQILHQLKYGHRPDIGITIGRFMAAELAGSRFFEGVDLLVPVPLHPRKKRRRGYNQSECLARGISAVTGIPTDTSLAIRARHTETQTRKSAYERWENVQDVFRAAHPERLAGKHVLLLDDVLTTSATLTACADAFGNVEGIRISILALAMADD